MSEFMFRALLGACALAAMLGPLGSFVVWRRMAYFGDTIAHASLLGVALSLLSAGAIPMTLAMFLVALVVALILARFTRDGRFGTDTLLGLLAHSSLALGLVLLSLQQHIRVDMNAFLFGDVLAMNSVDVNVLLMMAGIVFFLLRRFWRPLLMTTIDPATAAVEGVSAARMQLLLTVLLAAVIALAIKITGVLLITALLIMPAAAARYISATPKQMAIRASLIGMVSVSVGLFASVQIDVPSGPMMVVSAAGMFLLCALVSRTR